MPSNEDPPNTAATNGGRLAGRVAIVTGAGSGIGEGIALGFAEEGAAVVVNDLTDDRVAGTVDLVTELGEQAVASTGDVSERATADAMLDAALGQFGRVDALINNAGVLSFSSLLDMTDDEWDRVMRINTRSAFLCSQVLARHWVSNGTPGRIVNIASTQAEMASTMGLAHYCASKGAVRMLTRVAALELAPHAITVNAIGPGTVPTSIGSGVVTTAAEVEALAAHAAAQVPVGRMGTPRDIANLAVYMCAEGSEYMTGQLVMVDGGRNLSAGNAQPVVESS